MNKACVALIALVTWSAQAQAQSASNFIEKVLRLPIEQSSAHRVFTSELDKQQTLRLQQALVSLGYLKTKVDGEAGPATWEAVIGWARDRGWKPPRSLRAAHLDALEREAFSNRQAPATTVRSNDIGNRSLIERVQVGLAQLGYLKAAASGVLDQETRKAISEWARERGWETPDTIRIGHVDYIEKEVRERQLGLAIALSGSELKGHFTSGPSAGFERLAEEASSTPELTVDWEERDNFDHPGGDIRHGLIDPSLKGITQAACAKACLATDGCRIYTFNRMGNVCFLKEGSGKLIPFAGAVTALISGQRLKLGPPPTLGPGPELATDVSWQDTSSLDGYQDRIRLRARSLGGSCDAEEDKLAQLADDMTWKLETQTSQSGQAFSLTWAGNRLTERIPAWLIVSSPDRVRFAGLGHVGLGPEAANPFAIKTGKGETRALVSLASRGAGTTGKIDIVPLEVGKLTLNIKLVGYLRSCQKEISLKSDTASLYIAPAPAEIVLNTVEGRANLSHGIEVTKFSRTIILNEHRFLLLDTATGAEIIERAGSRLQVSPTHRFIAVNQGGKIEIIDIVDGRTATYVDSGDDLYWGLGDSYVFSTTSPWATVSIASTFSNGLQILGQMTGPSCCSATRESTRVGIDLENSVFSILGTLGYRIGVLQNPHYALLSDAQGGYSSQGGSDTETNRQMLQSIGTLSPVSLANGFDVPGGFRATSTGEDWSDSFDGNFQAKTFPDTLKILARVGLSANEVTDRYAGTLAAGGNSRPVEQILEEQLARLGIKVVAMKEGEKVVVPDNNRPQSHSAYDTAARLESSAEAMKQLQIEAKAAGWKTSWSLPEDAEGAPDCEHTVVDGESNRGRVTLPRDVVEAWKVGEGKTAAWIMRADCVAGATFGTLRAYRGYYAIDFSKKLPAKGRAFLVETSFLFENAIQEFWYDNAFRIKANSDFILSVSEGKGAIALIDRQSGEFAWIGQELPNGDLLLDAWLTADHQHVIQLNTDGGFYVHSLEQDILSVLSGRIVDDEIAVWTKDFHYDATAEAASLIDLKFPGYPAQFSLDRFGPAQRMPGLAQAVLSKNGIREQTRSIISLPPSLSGTIALDASGTIMTDLTFDAAQVAKIDVFQDGQLSQSFSGKELYREMRFERLKDARWISLVASTQEGLYSLPVLKDLGPSTSEKAVSRLLAVGINTYSHPSLPSLNYALRDAGQIMSTVTDKDLLGQSFELVQGPKDRAATPGAILAAARALTAGLERGDRAVLFLAGHGLRDADGRFYFATSATDPARLAETALSFDELRTILVASPASITLLLDACHSGAAGAPLSATNDELAKDFSQVGSNVTVVAAAKGRQDSIGRRETGGLFTDAIAKVIGEKRKMYDKDRNGRIEASELYRGVKSIVVEATDGAQTPWITKSRVVGDYAIF